MTIAGKAVLVTGANRGIGQALVEEALRRGAKRVYAGTRQPLAHPDGRVTPLTLDVTSAAQIQAAAEESNPRYPVNNAGMALYDDLSDRAALEQQLAVNLFGTYGVTQAFLPLLTRFPGSHRQQSVADRPSPPCRSPRPTRSQGGRVQPDAIATGSFGRTGRPGPCGPDRPHRHRDVPGLEIPKASPESVARAIFDGVENGEEDIFPDPLSESMAESWRNGAAKAFERQLAASVAAEPATA